MENAFAFDWMFNILSLGTAHLYRKYMVGAMVAVEEGVWRRLGGTCDNAAKTFLFQTFDEAYPDLIPTERLRLRDHWSFFVEGQNSDIDHEDRGLRTQVCVAMFFGFLTVNSHPTRLRSQNRIDQQRIIHGCLRRRSCLICYLPPERLRSG